MSRRLTVGFLVVAATGAGDATAQHDSRRRPVPAESERQRARGLMREVFASRYGALESGARSPGFAREVLSLGLDTRRDHAGRYELFDEAVRLAFAELDTATAHEALNRLCREYEIDSTIRWMATLKGYNQRASSDEQHRMVAELAWLASEVAVTADRYDAARQFADLGRASISHDGSVEADLLQAQIARVNMLGEQHRAVAPTLRALRELEPVAAADVARAGAFLCFEKGDWLQGLGLLTYATGELQGIARADLRRPTEASDILAVAEGWWEIAHGGEQVRVEPLYRALQWYRRALPQLGGMDKRGAAQRLEEGRSRMEARMTEIRRAERIGWNEVSRRLRAGIDSDAPVPGAPPPEVILLR